MNRPTRGSSLVFAALNCIQSNLCMAADKEKDKKHKATEKLAAETAAKKKEDEEAQVAATFMAP
eukprot:3778886-Rhodomonas_salina.1